MFNGLRSGVVLLRGIIFLVLEFPCRSGRCSRAHSTKTITPAITRRAAPDVVLTISIRDSRRGTFCPFPAPGPDMAWSNIRQKTPIQCLDGDKNPLPVAIPNIAQGFYKDLHFLAGIRPIPCLVCCVIGLSSLCGEMGGVLAAFVLKTVLRRLQSFASNIQAARV